MGKVCKNVEDLFVVVRKQLSEIQDSFLDHVNGDMHGQGGNGPSTELLARVTALEATIAVAIQHGTVFIPSPPPSGCHYLKQASGCLYWFDESK